VGRSRHSVRLEERYGRNECKVDDDGLDEPAKDAIRTLVTHWTSRAIHRRTRARSSSDGRPASPKVIVPIANAWFLRKVRQVWVGG
jgi:hypothetical protein